MRRDYYQTARESETVFRGILRDLKEHADKRPGRSCITEDLDAESPLEELFKKYSEGPRMERFTILDFSRPTKHTARLSFENVATLSGAGAELEYIVREDSSVEYRIRVSHWIS